MHRHLPMWARISFLFLPLSGACRRPPQPIYSLPCAGARLARWHQINRACRLASPILNQASCLENPLSVEPIQIQAASLPRSRPPLSAVTNCVRMRTAYQPAESEHAACRQELFAPAGVLVGA
eukprot:1818799-Pleurochrysis_carterae.AAC.1